MIKKPIKFIALLLCFLLCFEQSGFAQVETQNFASLHLSAHLASFHNTLTIDKYRPLHLRYLRYNSKNNDFNLLLDKGDFLESQNSKGKSQNYNSKLKIKENSQLTTHDSRLIHETKKLMEYFLIGLSLPNESFWVNLRPDSPDNVIDSELAKTDIGKILLEADVQLKKDTAVWTSPQTSEGRKYWNKLYKKAEELYGYENITIPTLTRPWIVPGEIIISEANDTAYIYKAALKVCLEEDYLESQNAKIKSQNYNSKFKNNQNNKEQITDARLKQLNTYSTQLIKELIIPKLTKEVNSSKRYAGLRQVYYSLILAQWFKQRRTIDDGRWKIDSGNLVGLISKTTWSKETYYQQYQASFKDGEYNLQEPVNTPYGKTVRTYMSGGTALTACVPLLGPVSSGLREKIPTKTGEPFVCIGSSAINQEEERVTKDYLIKAKVEGAEGNNIGNIEIVSSGIDKGQKIEQAKELKEIEKLEILYSYQSDKAQSDFWILQQEIKDDQKKGVKLDPQKNKKLMQLKKIAEEAYEEFQKTKTKHELARKKLYETENPQVPSTLSTSSQPQPQPATSTITPAAPSPAPTPTTPLASTPAPTPASTTPSTSLPALPTSTQLPTPPSTPQSNIEPLVNESNYRAVIADVGIKVEAIANRLALERFNREMQEGGFFKRLWRRSIYYRWTRPALLKRYAGEFEQALYDLVNNGIAIDNNKLPELGNEFARKGIPFNSAESFLANLDNIIERIEEQQKLGAVVTDAFDARETPMNRAFPSATVQKAIDDINKLIINYIQSNMTDEDFNKALRPILNSIRNELGAKVLGSNLLSKAKELRNAGNINLDNFKLDIAFTNAKEADVRVRNTGGRINQAVTKVINKTQSIPVARWFTSPMALGLAAFLGVNGGMMLSAGALSGLIVPALAVAIPIGILAGMRQNAEVNQNYQQVDLRQSLGLTTAKATKLEQKLQKAVVDKLDVQKAIKDLSVANADKDKVVILIGEILSRITQGRESGIELFKYAPNIDEEKQKVDLLRSVNSLIVGLKLSPDELKKSQQDETAKLQQKINISNKNFRKVKSREDIKAVVISAGTAIAFSYLIGWLFRGWMGMGSQPVSNTAGAAAPSSKQVTAYTLQEFLAKNSGKLNSSELQSALKEAGISNPKKIISELFPSGKVSIGKLIEHLTSGSASGEKLAAVLEKYVERACGGIDIQFANSSNFLRVLWQAPGLKEQLQKKGIKDFSKFAAAFEKEMSSITKGSWSLSGTLKGILSNNHLAKDAETIILQGINKSPSLKANLEEVLRQNDFLGSQGSIQRFFENFTDGGRVIGSTMARYKQFMVNPAKFQKFVNKALGIYKTAGTNSNWAQAGQQLRSLLWKEGVLHPADRVNIAFDWVHRFSGWNVKAVEGTATNDFLRIFFDITRIAQPIKLTEAAAAVEQTAAETAKALGYFLGPMLSGAPYYGLGVVIQSTENRVQRTDGGRQITKDDGRGTKDEGETKDEGRGTKDEGETKDEGREKKDEIKLSVPEDLKQGQGQDGQQINEGRGTREEGQTKDEGRGTKDDVQNLAAAQGTLTTLEFDLKQAEDKSAELEKQLEKANQDFASAEDVYLQAKADYEKADKNGEEQAKIDSLEDEYNQADKAADNAAQLANQAQRALVAQEKLTAQLRDKHNSLTAQIVELGQNVSQLIPTPAVPVSPISPVAPSQPASQVEQPIKPGSDFKPISAEEQKVDYIPPPAELKPVGISPKSEIIDIEFSPELPLPQSQPQVPQTPAALPVSTTPLQPAQPQPPVSELSQPSQQPQTDNNAPERAGNAMGIDAGMQKEIIELWQKKGGGNFDSFKTEFKVKFPGLTIEVVKKIREDWIIAVIHKGEENKGIFLPRKKAAASDVYAYLGFDGSTIDTRYRILEGLQAPLPDCKKGDDGVWMIDGSSRVKIQVEWQSGVREDNSKREWLGPPKLESSKQNLSFFKTDLENLKKSLAEVNESLVEPEKKVETHSDSLAIAQAELTAAMQAGDSDAQKEKFQTVEYIKKQLKGKQLFIQIQKEKIGKNLKEQEEIEVKIAKMEREIQVMQDENFEKPSITPTTLTLLPAPQADVDGKESQIKALTKAIQELNRLEKQTEESAQSKAMIDANVDVIVGREDGNISETEMKRRKERQDEAQKKYHEEVLKPIEEQKELITQLQSKYTGSERFKKLEQSIIYFWLKTQTWGLPKYKESLKEAYPDYEIDTMGRDDGDWMMLAVIIDRNTGEAVILPRRLADWYSYYWFDLAEEGKTRMTIVKSMQSLAVAIKEDGKWICVKKGKISIKEPAVSSSLVDNKGGIDLTHMPAAIMRQPALINPAAGLTPALSREIFSINLNQECGQIEKMMAADIAVSDERLRVLMIVCCRSASSSVSLDKMRDYIAFKIRIDEKFCRPTNTALLKMLELLELNQPPEVMINTLASLSIAPKR